MSSNKRAPEGAPVEVPDILIDPTPNRTAKYEKGRFLGKVIMIFNVHLYY